ncbi:MAG: hypothetical protein WDA06_01000 [Phenylobacterium sp.]
MDLWEFNGTRKDVEDAMDKIDAAFPGVNWCIELDYNGIKITEYRLETDKEFKERITKSKQEKISREQDEKQQLKRLLAKYGKDVE